METPSICDPIHVLSALTLMKQTSNLGLKNHLAPDLYRAGLEVLFSRKDLAPGRRLTNFQKKIMGADRVVIACTPETKTKALDRESKKLMKGIAGNYKCCETVLKTHTFEQVTAAFRSISKETKQQPLSKTTFQVR